MPLETQYEYWHVSIFCVCFFFPSPYHQIKATNPHYFTQTLPMYYKMEEAILGQRGTSVEKICETLAQELRLEDRLRLLCICAVSASMPCCSTPLHCTVCRPGHRGGGQSCTSVCAVSAFASL